MATVFEPPRMIRRHMGHSSNMPMRSVLSALAALVAVVSSSACFGQPAPDYDFPWATITNSHNRGYDGPSDFGRDYRGRGSVAYEYRISQQEVSSAQWVEFVNTFSVQPDFPPLLFGGRSFTRGLFLWGGYLDPTYSGPGNRFRTNGEGFNYDLRPVFGLTWRDAAMFCNWLHNGKSSDPSSLYSGAYDTSTWNTAPATNFTDALTHEPGARFWIPTLDEWMKAVFYDPNKSGPGQDGWWRYCNSSDLPPVPGFPGTPGATTSAGIDTPNVLELLDLDLGSYPDALSPWGLLDTSSGALEWLEDNFSPTGLRERGVGGSWAGDLSYEVDAHAAGFGSRYLAGGDLSSFRVASLVPEPSALAIYILLLKPFRSRRRDR
jgi:hypothetical protein